jgi:hypothetical protein
MSDDPYPPVARPVRRPDPHDARERVSRLTRLALGLMAAGFVGVFVIAAVLNPYQPDGSPRSMATHTQLGLPPCNMVVMTGKPCPTCGMTTSFALLMHGDVGNSLRANWAGTLLALFWLALVPWAAWGAVRGRVLWVRNLELAVTAAVGIGLAVTLGRWAAVLLWG